MRRQTPIFIVASPRPRVGKTLIARVLTEYLRAQGEPVVAYDLNPDAYALIDYLPALTLMASVEDIRDQMGLFDQLVLPDLMCKVIDLGHVHFEKFFTVMHDISFAREARGHAVMPVVLFVADGERRTQNLYAILQRRLPGLALVPVFNDAVPVAAHLRAQFPVINIGGAPLKVPALSAVVKPVMERPGFSFAAYHAKITDPTAELYGWTRDMFLQFHELELRLLLEEMKPSLRS